MLPKSYWWCHIVQPLDYCHYKALAVPVEWLVAIAMPCNSWLFFIRVRGIYIRSPKVVVLFSVLWATTLLSFCFPFGYTIKTIRSEGGSCTSIFYLSDHLLPLPLVALVVFDTAVIIAISVHLTMHDSSRSWTSRLKSVIVAKHMGQITRSFLRSGQVYYL